MILPVFDCCAVVWDSCSKADREFLDKLHRRAISIIEGYAVSQSLISYTFGWPTLQSRRDYLKCMLHGLAPAYLHNDISHAHDFPSYNMRHRDLLRLEHASSSPDHDLNKFGFGIERHFRSKPNWASNAFIILSCSNFLICYCFLCCFFLFIRAPFKPASLNWAPLNKMIVQNK